MSQRLGEFGMSIAYIVVGMSNGSLAEATRREVTVHRCIQVQYVSTTRGQSRAFVELWTGHHVYSVDRDLICFQVTPRHGERAQASQVVGARLAGGEAWNEKAELTEICMPLPLPGTRAVFQVPQVTERTMRTSPIERVVLYLYLLSVGQSVDTAVGDGE